MQIGIVGLPYSGKTTLFQTMTKTHLDEDASHHIVANTAIVKVPDHRVEKLAEFFNPKKLVYTSIEFVDVVGLKKGDRESTQFTSVFLNNVKTNDALIHVVRMFDDPYYPHPEGGVDPERDIRILESEFLLSDMAMIENRIGKLKMQIQKTQDEKLKYELGILEKSMAALEEEQPLRVLPLDPIERKTIRGYQFLSEKPLLAVLNLDEKAIGRKEELVSEIQSKFTGSGIAFDAFSGKVEMEMAQLPDEDAAAFMEEYGISESALERIISSAYNMLGLISFLTVGDDECRAWMIRQGETAHEAAGVIHTDLMNRFIRAEVVHYNDFVEHGSFTACKEKGAWRLEGKEYIVKDGDILMIRHG